MRKIFVALHRWLGLATALFLFIAGATGAVISWDHELDEWLNPQLFQSRTEGRPLPVLELAARVEAAEPRARITFMPLEIEPGHAWSIFVQPRIDPATGQPHELGYNQLAVDPVTGAIQGRRQWGAVSLSPENLLPFLYKLHYSMHLPEGGGIEWGIWLMGIVAMVWVFDSFIALWISFPSWPAWRKSLSFRWSRGGHRLAFDLHRSGGVWVWLLVLMLAVTSVSMNLKQQVMRPVVSWFSDLSAGPFDSRLPAPISQPIEPTVPLPAIMEAARREAQRRGWTDPAGGVFLSTEVGVYGVGFFEPGNSHGDGGLGNPWLYYDSRTGAAVGADVPGTGTAGDIFLQSMFPLHSGRILGLPGRVLMSFMGVMIALLSVTGVYLWVRKRVSRSHAMATTHGRFRMQPRVLEVQGPRE